MAQVDTRYGYVTHPLTSDEAIDLNASTDVVVGLGGAAETPIQFLNTSFLELESQLTVYHIDAVTDFETELVLDTDWTAALNGSNNEVTIKYTATTITEWATGDTIRIERTLKETRNYTDWTNNTQITADQLDYSQDHTFFLVQQALDSARDALRLGTNGAWNGEGIRSYNCAPATSNNGWVTLSQVSNLISGTETAEVADMYYWTLTGNGVVDTLSLTGFAGTIAPEDLVVHLDGVMQIPTTDYTVASTAPPVVTFTTAPATGTKAHVRLLQGTVAAVVVSDAIDGDALVPDSVDESKFGFVAGDNNRVIFIGTLGQPTLSTITSAKIADFDTQVRTSSLSQMAAPTGDLDMDSNQITGLTDGSTGTKDACTVDQMEVAVSAIGQNPVFQGFVTQNVSSGKTYTAPTGTWVAAMVTVEDNGDGYSCGLVKAGGAVKDTTKNDVDISMAAGGASVTIEKTGYTAALVNIMWIA